MMIDSPPIPGEEDYRVKNAREGRAIYVPGKSVAETRAKLGLPPLEDDPVVSFGELFAHAKTEIAAINDLANDVQHIVGTLARSLEVLRKGVGDYIDESELDALLQIAGHFAKGAADKECDSLIMKIMKLERTLASADQ